MKIALVYDAVYPFIKGGGEKRFFEIGKRLAEKGHQVHFYGMNLWKADEVSIFEKQNIYYHGISKKKVLYTKNGKRSFLEAIHFGFCCLKLIKEDFDIIDCCNFPYFSLLSCKLVSKIKKKPLFSTWHEVWGKNYWLEYIGWKGYLGYFIEKLTSMMPDEIISVSGHTTFLLRTALHSKKLIHTVPNGIELDLISSISASEERSDIIYAGRLMDFKHIDVLVRAVGKIKEQFPDIRCLIIGDGPERAKLEKLVKKMDLRKNISFLGFLENSDDVFSFMKASKLFVLPSTREGFGIAAIEANACGIPVLTIDHKDNAARDLIRENKNGFISMLDDGEIAGIIIKVLACNLAKDMKKYCLDFAKQYEWDKIVDEVEEVYLQ